MSGSTIVSILLWAENGKKTLAQAEKSGRAASEAWAKCIQLGYLRVDAGGWVKLTEGGTAYLDSERMCA